MKHSLRFSAPLIASLFLAQTSLFAADAFPSLRAPETPQQHDERMAWWREAKFGMFIHWGLYAIPASGEWNMRNHQVPMAQYAKYADQFNPVKFNADEWASVAEAAGMKYMVPTTKHHDGFAMFHSKASAYNIFDATPFHRDPLKELSEACPKHGIRLGVYYSVIADWGHPGGGAGCPKWDKAQEGSLDDYINNVSVPQVKELLTNYGPIAVLWFDTDGAKVQSQKQLLPYIPILKLQPNLIIDPRLPGIPGDFATPEGHIPMIPPVGDWELCDCVNGSWGYTAAPARPLARLLKELCEAWGKGGNVLLNVGPTQEGVIPPDSVERLKQIGSWLKINGAAIYGSTRGPFEYVPWGWETTKGDMLYLLVSNWPSDGKLKLPTEASIEKGWLLTNPKQLVSGTVKDGVTTLTLPTSAPDPNVSVVALKMKAPVPHVGAITTDCRVTASENQNGAKNTTSARGGDWEIKNSTGSLTIDLGKPQIFDTLRLTAPHTEVKQVLLEVQSGNDWIKVLSIEDIKPKETEWIKTFPAAKGQIVRLTVTAKKPEVRVGCIELFSPL